MSMSWLFQLPLSARRKRPGTRLHLSEIRVAFVLKQTSESLLPRPML